MRGLKTQESHKFNRFWELIQSAARKRDCVFFGYAGEGRDFETEDMEGEDFSGWLVPIQNADTFEREWKKDFGKLFQEKTCEAKFTFAFWKEADGRISIVFENYQ